MRPHRLLHRLTIAVGYGLGAAALLAGLQRDIPPAWHVPGAGIVWLGTPIVAFLLPTALAVTDALLRGLVTRDPVDEAGSPNMLSVYDAIMLRIAIFVTGVHATALAAALGILHGRGWAVQIVPVMLGLTLIGIGNLLPRTRPNLAIGIRTRRTLADRALWIRTHRSVGMLVVALGAVLVLAAIVLPPPIGSGMILLAGPAGGLGICYLVWHSRARASGAEA
jgi:uncharacterized membrane protein